MNTLAIEKAQHHEGEPQQSAASSLQSRQDAAADYLIGLYATRPQDEQAAITAAFGLWDATGATPYVPNGRHDNGKLLEALTLAWKNQLGLEKTLRGHVRALLEGEPKAEASAIAQPDNDVYPHAKGLSLQTLQEQLVAGHALGDESRAFVISCLELDDPTLALPYTQDLIYGSIPWLIARFHLELLLGLLRQDDRVTAGFYAQHPEAKRDDLSGLQPYLMQRVSQWASQLSPQDFTAALEAIIPQPHLAARLRTSSAVSALWQLHASCISKASYSAALLEALTSLLASETRRAALPAPMLFKQHLQNEIEKTIQAHPERFSGLSATEAYPLLRNGKRRPLTEWIMQTVLKDGRLVHTPDDEHPKRPVFGRRGSATHEVNDDTPPDDGTPIDKLHDLLRSLTWEQSTASYASYVNDFFSTTTAPALAGWIQARFLLQTCLASQQISHIKRIGALVPRPEHTHAVFDADIAADYGELIEVSTLEGQSRLFFFDRLNGEFIRLNAELRLRYQKNQVQLPDPTTLDPSYLKQLGQLVFFSPMQQAQEAITQGNFFALGDARSQIRLQIIGHYPERTADPGSSVPTAQALQACWQCLTSAHCQAQAKTLVQSQTQPTTQRLKVQAAHDSQALALIKLFSAMGQAIQHGTKSSPTLEDIRQFHAALEQIPPADMGTYHALQSLFRVTIPFFRSIIDLDDLLYRIKYQNHQATTAEIFQLVMSFGVDAIALIPVLSAATQALRASLAATVKSLYWALGRGSGTLSRDILSRVTLRLAALQGQKFTPRMLFTLLQEELWRKGTTLLGHGLTQAEIQALKGILSGTAIHWAQTGIVVAQVMTGGLVPLAYFVKASARRAADALFAEGTAFYQGHRDKLALAERLAKQAPELWRLTHKPVPNQSLTTLSNAALGKVELIPGSFYGIQGYQFVNPLTGVGYGPAWVKTTTDGTTGLKDFESLLTEQGELSLGQTARYDTTTRQLTLSARSGETLALKAYPVSNGQILAINQNGQLLSVGALTGQLEGHRLTSGSVQLGPTAAVTLKPLAPAEQAQAFESLFAASAAEQRIILLEQASQIRLQSPGIVTLPRAGHWLASGHNVFSASLDDKRVLCRSIKIEGEDGRLLFQLANPYSGNALSAALYRFEAGQLKPLALTGTAGSEGISLHDSADPIATTGQAQPTEPLGLSVFSLQGKTYVVQGGSGNFALIKTGDKDYTLRRLSAAEQTALSAGLSCGPIRAKRSPMDDDGAPSPSKRLCLALSNVSDPLALPAVVKIGAQDFSQLRQELAFDQRFYQLHTLRMSDAASQHFLQKPLAVQIHDLLQHKSIIELFWPGYFEHIERLQQTRILPDELLTQIVAKQRELRQILIDQQNLTPEQQAAMQQLPLERSALPHQAMDLMYGLLNPHLMAQLQRAFDRKLLHLARSMEDLLYCVDYLHGAEEVKNQLTFFIDSTRFDASYPYSESNRQMLMQMAVVEERPGELAKLVHLLREQEAGLAAQTTQLQVELTQHAELRNRQYPGAAVSYTPFLHKEAALANSQNARVLSKHLALAWLKTFLKAGPDATDKLIQT